MSTALYSIHMSQTFKLAKTLVIKFDLTANAINRFLIENNLPVDVYQPVTWKYYKNMAGEYHFTDTPMTVQSLDTLETIEFTKQNLQIHRATAREYQYGTQYYNELVARFPEQEDLILGILHPVDIDTAIAAESGTILYFDENLIDSNEYDLIPRVERWIKRTLVRWSVPGYSVIQDLYAAWQCALIGANLPMVIENIRLSNCHTNRASGFHIRMFLGSHCYLDEFYDYLTTDMALWLYRNVRYLRNNVGKQDTFYLMVENILSKRNIPLMEYALTHDTENMIANMLPNTKATPSPVNLFEFGGRNVPIDVDLLVHKLDGVAKNNVEVAEEEIAYVHRRFSRSPISEIPTKVLESQIVDLSESGRYKRSDVLMQYWLYMASTGRYNSTISFTNPNDGEVYRMAPNDAWIAMTFFLLRSMGSTTDNIPTFYAHDILRVPAPTFELLRSISSPKYITDEFIQLLLSDLPPIGSYISTDAFIEACEVIHARMARHYYQYVGMHDFMARGEAERLVLGFYNIVEVQPTTFTSYAAWMEAKGVNFENADTFSYDAMGAEIIANATGIGRDATKSLKELQQALLRLMSRLSSYTVTYIPTINTEPFIDVGGPSIGPSYETWEPSIEITHANINVGVIKQQYRSYSSIDMELPLLNSDHQYNATDDIVIYQDITLDYNVKCHNSRNLFIDNLLFNSVNYFEE